MFYRPGCHQLKMGWWHQLCKDVVMVKEAREAVFCHCGQDYDTGGSSMKKNTL